MTDYLKYVMNIIAYCKLYNCRIGNCKKQGIQDRHIEKGSVNLSV